MKGLRLIIPGEVVKTLLETCFRGKKIARSGNSFRWDSPEEMVQDPVFLHRFLYILLASLEENGVKVRDGYEEDVTVQFDPETPIGWAGAVSRDCVNGARLHLAKLGDQDRGMFVAADDVDHPAPLTNLISLKIGCKPDFKNADELAVRILDVRIGPDLDSIATPVRFHPHHVGGSDIIPMEP